LFIDPDGSEADWIVGYGPPADDFQKQVDKVLQGVDTFKSYQALYNKDPKSLEAVFKLAEKYGDRYNTEKANEMYKQVIALDPNGKKGMTEYGRDKVKVTYTQYAEFNIAEGAFSSRPPNAAPLLAFVKKYPDSQIIKDAYSRLGSFYGRQGSKDDATKFFEEYTGRFPQEAMAFYTWAARILFDKDPVDKGITLAQKAVDLSQGRQAMSAYQNLARLYLLKGDKDKAVGAADQMMKLAATPPPAKPGAVPATPMDATSMAAPMAAPLYIEAGHPEKALAIYGPEFLKKNMDNASNLGRYAQFWSNQGQNLESALTAAKKITELTPDGYSGFNALGSVYLKMKNYAEALKAAEKALALAPAQPPMIKQQIQKTIDNIKAQAAEKK
jgi:tetratricopeptide (TPR) repeat protein